MYRLGNLLSSPPTAPHQAALREELARQGFVEGHNLWIDRDGYGLAIDQLGRHATVLVGSGVDVIIAGGDAAVRTAQQATAEIPILALTDDMVGQGFVHSLARPGGNITGVTILAAELDGKRQEILLEAVPGTRHIAVLADSTITSNAHLNALAEEAAGRGIALSVHRARSASGLISAIDGAAASGATAINVLASAFLFNNRAIVFDRIAAVKLPAVYQWPEMAREGGFLGYGPSIVQLYRDVQSRQLIRLLRGAKPADLPVEQPTKFGLIINLKTATALSLTVPPSLLARADEIIE
ncbi:MAG TPA: ABC transporter substrate-binding protein [Stellaceae bacterium]|nr:ABC transporter substrate-binding protein [Stellaceae bacterium]